MVHVERVDSLKMNKKLKSLQKLVAVLFFISLSISVQQSECAVSSLPTCPLLWIIITAYSYNTVIIQL